MKKVTCIHTGYGLSAPIEKMIKDTIGECSVNHIVDSGILGDLIRDNSVSELSERRLLCLFDAAMMPDPDIIICTCSSIGDVSDKAAALHPEHKIIRIDHAMAKYAVDNFSKIAVMANLGSTVGPSCTLVERIAAEQGKKVEVSHAVAGDGKAFKELITGNPAGALAYMKETALELAKNAEVILLAQASMGPFAEEISKATGLPVYTSPAMCAAEVKEILG